MASTYTTKLRLELQTTGENSTAWGNKANDVFERLELAISGFTSVSVTTADVTLSTSNSESGDDEASSAMIKTTGVLTGNRSVIVPTYAGKWVVWNANTGAYTTTVKTSAGTGIAVPQGTVMHLSCDGTNVIATSPSITTAGAMSGSVLSGGTITSPTISGGTLTGGTLSTTSLTTGTITNSTVNSTPVGNSSPSTGQFTTLQSTGDTTLGDASADAVTINAKNIGMANKSAFIAYLSATQSDKTGDGTTYTVPIDSEVYDQGSDYASNVFTAPTTGRYSFSGNVLLSGLTTSHTSYYVNLVTNNRTYSGERIA
jgi:hypothetical protein